MEQSPRGISNVGIRSRLKQLIVLIIAIVVGVLLSQTVNAQNGPPRYRHAKHYFKVHKSGEKTCQILSKKRTQQPKAHSVASRRPKFRPMPEVDSPTARKNPQVAKL